MKKILNTIGRLAMLSCLAFAGMQPLNAKTKRIKAWDWTRINSDDLSFPQGFLWGSSTSATQVEGNCNNSWTEFETSPKGRLIAKEPVGIACDHWNRYKEDIARMRELGLNAYRFSIEWSKIEPQEGIFDQAAINHYRDMCKELRANGIEPIVVFHHYSEPIWFRAKNGFERKENLHYFLRFATKMFTELNDTVNMWLTFNSPTSYVMHGYKSGDMAPGIKDDFTKAMNVLYNLLCVHTDIYHAIKALPGGAQARVGITHNIYQVEPKHKRFFVTNWLNKKASNYARGMMDESVYNFFKEGKFAVHVPGKVHIKTHDTRYHNARAVGALDYVALNYYSRGVLDWFKTKQHSKEIKADNDKYTICPEGFYAAIEDISINLARPLNIPIYVTENGISTADEWKRDLFYRRYLYAMSQAIKAGHDVRGYCTWSFMDNYSWKEGYSRHYGLIPVDRVTLERGPLKTGAQHYINVVNQFNR